MRFICLVVFLIQILNIFCDNNINLRLEMYKFDNQYGIKADRRCCFDDEQISNKCSRKCLTFFRFCLKLKQNEKGSECLSEFETQVIGENIINKNEFNQTTDLIEFPLSTEQLKSNQLILSIEVYNDKSIYGQKQHHKQQLKNLTPERELISKWILNLNNNASLLNNNNEMNLFDYKNKFLNQQLIFSYKFECSKNYNGVDCLSPICSNGCDLEKGGYCLKPNECLCKQGWTGRQCNIEASESAECTLDCKNNAKCVFDKINNKQFCDCDKTLFDGELCEISLVKTCNLTYICLNGGTCLDNGKCICAPGYSGERCQIKSLPNQCGDKICYNDASCVINNENNYECQCKSYFTGVQCETSLNMCITNKPCKNNAQCVWNSTQSTYQCLCAVGFTGVNCDQIEKKLNALPIQPSSESSIFSSMIGNIVDRSKQDEILTTTASTTQSSSLTMNEVVAILTIGITLPILLILILLLVIRVYTNRRINKQLKTLTITSAASATASSTQIEIFNNKPSASVNDEDVDLKKPTKKAKAIDYDTKSLKKQNDCVIFDIETSTTTTTATSSTLNSSEDIFIKNNIYDDKIHKKEKLVYVNNIQESLVQSTKSKAFESVSYNNMMASIV